MKRLLTLFALLTLPLLTQAQVETTYKNPVLPGNLPDPTMIRVGDTYYAAGTSSEWAPAYRLYESKDLVNWQYLGGLFREIPDWTMGSYWAPELYYHDGTYFVYYTARRKSDKKSFIGVATTRDIRQGFTDHGILIEWTNEAIDAYVIDWQGKRYITWKAYGLDKGRPIEILGSELTDDGLRLKGDVFSLVTAEPNWEAGGIEGQCIVEHDGYLYMFYAGNACCGAQCNYMTGVARARSIQGPWEKYADNPILHASDEWRCPGHGTLVETPDHRFFYLYHAYNAGSNIYTGRQGMLDEVIWDKTTGWPAFRYGTTPSLQASAPYPGTIQLPPADFIADFNAANLHAEWIWDVAKAKPRYTLKEGKLTVEGDDSLTGSLLALRPQKENYRFSATIEQTDARSGLCLYGTQQQAVGISIGNNRVIVWMVKEGKFSLLATEMLTAPEATLYVDVSFGQYCRFGYRTKEGKDHPFGELIQISNLPQWDRPQMIGIQVKGENKKGIFSRVALTY